METKVEKSGAVCFPVSLVVPEQQKALRLENQHMRTSYAFPFQGNWYGIRLVWNVTTVRVRIVDAYDRPANRVELIASIDLMRDMGLNLLGDFARETIERNEGLCRNGASI